MLRRKWPLLKSLNHAIFGIWVAFRDEYNMRTHGVLTVIAVGLAFYLKISSMEWLIILLVITLVWIAELTNTAIEESFNIHDKEDNEQVKLGKDVAAAAVLVASLNAFITGCIIFVPKIILLWQ